MISADIAAGGGYTESNIIRQDADHNRQPKIPSPKRVRGFTLFQHRAILVTKKCTRNANAQTVSLKKSPIMLYVGLANVSPGQNNMTDHNKEDRARQNLL
jgi:hypothetical protein